MTKYINSLGPNGSAILANNKTCRAIRFSEGTFLPGIWVILATNETLETIEIRFSTGRWSVKIAKALSQNKYVKNFRCILENTEMAEVLGSHKYIETLHVTTKNVSMLKKLLGGSFKFLTVIYLGEDNKRFSSFVEEISSQDVCFSTT